MIVSRWSSKLLDENNFWEELKRDFIANYKSGNRSAMIFIHGYNVTFEDAQGEQRSWDVIWA